jgi:hypothetical protein
LGKDAYRQRFIAVISAYVLGLLLAAAYWLPAFTELHYVHVQAAADQFQLQDNFVRLRDLIGPVRAPDRGSMNMPFTFSAGLGSLLLGILGGGVALSPRVKLSRWQRGHVLAGLLLSVVCLYLMTYRSLWIWQMVPKATLILFPWRLLSVLTVALIPGAVLALSLIPERGRSWTVAVLIAILFGSMLPLMFPLYDNEPDLGTVTPATSVQYEITSGNLGGVSNNEYLPKWAVERPDFAPCPECYRDWNWEIFVTDRDVPETTQLTSISADHKAGSGFQVSSPEAFRLELHQMYFPGWQATVDGDAAALITTEPYGLLALDVPAGEHTVQVWYAGTRTQHVANGLSLVALGLSGALLLRRRIFRPRLVISRQGAGRAGAAVVVAVIVSVVLRGIIAPQTDWFREQGNRTDPPGMETSLGTVFTDAQGTPALKLIGYTLSDTTAGYGDWLFVTLYWQALTPLDETWHVRLALADSFSLSEWSASDHETPGGYSTRLWSTDRYIIDPHILRLDDDIPPYVGDVMVRVYTTEGNELWAGDSPRLTLNQVRIEETGTATLPPTAQRVDILFGGWLRCRAYALVPVDEGYQLRLYWQVLHTPPADYALMLHWQSGEVELSQVDQPPISSYPTTLWQGGQYLTSAIDLEMPAEADGLLIGLYDYPTVQRAPVDLRVGDLVVENDTVLLPLTSSP